MGSELCPLRVGKSCGGSRGKAIAGWAHSVAAFCPRSRAKKRPRRAESALCLSWHRSLFSFPAFSALLHLSPLKRFPMHLPTGSMLLAGYSLTLNLNPHLNPNPNPYCVLIFSGMLCVKNSECGFLL